MLAIVRVTKWREKMLVNLTQNGYTLLRCCIIVFTNHQVTKCDVMAVKKGLFLDLATFLF